MTTTSAPWWRCAVEHQKPVRIGVNWGSLDQALLTKMMDENSKCADPLPARDVMMEAMVVSALDNAAAAERYGLRRDQIILSAKVSGVRDLIDVYTELARRCDYALHLGLTEAGMGMKGVVASTAGLGPSAAGWNRGYDSGEPDAYSGWGSERGGSMRAADSAVARDSQLYAAGDELPRLRADDIDLLSGAGGADSELPGGASMPEWKKQYPGVEELKLAVMGCIVNGPGESKHANIGISLPGTFEEPKAPVYVDGKLFTTLKGDRIVEEFQVILDEYVEKRYGRVLVEV